MGRNLNDLGPQVGGQEDAEDGAVVFGGDGGAELHFAAVTLDDGAGDPEAEAGAALAFGGEEGLAEAAPDFGRNAAAVVADGDTNAVDAGIGPAARAADAEKQTAVERRGFDGVGDEVGEDLAHLAGIDESLFGAVVLALDANALLQDAAAVEGEHFFEELVDVGAHGSGGFAGELEGLAADLGDAVELALGEGEIAGDGGGEIFFRAEKIEKVGDGLKGVVDLVRDRGSEAADGDELLILAQHDGGAVELMLGAGLENGRLADLEGAGDGGGQTLHFAGVQNFGGSLTENADGFRFGDAAAGEQDGDGRIGGAGAVDDFANLDIGKAFGAGDEEIDGIAAEIVEEFAAVLGKFDIEGEAGVAGGRTYGMMRQRRAGQHQHSRDGMLSHGDTTRTAEANRDLGPFLAFRTGSLSASSNAIRASWFVLLP